MALKTPRKKTAKSRSGCRQCKIRRIKCDEKEPACDNCSRRGLECPGYVRGLRFSVKHERFHEKRATASSPVQGNATSSRVSADQAAVNSTSETAGAETSDAQATTTLAQSQGTSEISWEWDDLAWLNDWDDLFQSPSDLVSRVDFVTTTKTVALSDSYPSHHQLFSSAFFSSPIDLPKTLVEYWFKHVCPMWSSFDSEENYNRKLPLDTWTTSEPVFYALQAMSAACLADSMPQIKSLLPSLITQATATIERKMSALRSAPNIPALSINIDLLFAVFAMGTSLHWTDTSQFGDEMLQSAQEALGLLVTNLSAADAVVHTYFHQALTHWEMMHSLADRGPLSNNALDRKRSKYQTRLRQAMQLDNHMQYVEQSRSELPKMMGSDSCGGNDVLVVSQFQRHALDKTAVRTRLHSWCGISNEVIDVFGQVLALCRCARTRFRERKAWTAAATTNALSDIGVAHDLQQELLAMDFNDIADGDKLRGISLQTGDEKTPISHLIHIAEAYRLAGLAQLYLTFDDLEIKHPMKDFRSASADHAAREQKLVVMALDLVTILEQVPAESGSRCIHPPLLILAAAGLRMNYNSCHQEVSSSFPQQTFRNSGSPGAPPLDTLMDNTERSSWDVGSTAMTHLPQGDYSPLDDMLGNSNITRATLEVAKARQFIRGRLHALQTNLPPKPIQVALDLVNAIWTRYDRSNSGSEGVHWQDVMSQTGLQTIFG